MVDWSCTGCGTVNGAGDAQCFVCGAKKSAVATADARRTPVPAPVLTNQPPADSPSAPPAVVAPPVTPVPVAVPVSTATAPTRRGNSTGPQIALLVVGVLLVGIVIGALVARSGDRSDGSDSANPAQGDDRGGSATPDPGSSNAEPTSADEFDEFDEPPTTTTRPGTTTTINPEAAALKWIERRVAADTPAADARVLDRWVPQLSSKKLGLTDRETGVTYSTYQSIIDDLLASEASYGEVLFVDSATYSTFSKSDRYYVTLAAIGFSTAEEANGWCDARSMPANSCFAKFLSRTAPAGSDMQTYR